MVTPARPRRGELWLRWSWRDLRRHWVAVVAIALVLAIGIGVYAGLGSSATWRRESNDASFSRLAMHDVRVGLNPGTFTDEGRLIEAAQGIEASASIIAVEERLVLDSQIDAGDATTPILAAARLVGMDVSGDAAVDRLWIRAGRAPVTASASEPVGVIEAKFAEHWELPTAGTVQVAGGRPVSYSGFGMIPEDFFYEGPEGTLLAEGELAPLYLPLAAVQDLVERPDQVNDLVLTLEDGTDRAAVVEQLSSAMTAADVGVAVTTREEADAVRVLYEDIENDQRFWNALAGLVLMAAALAAFNLINRIVEAQRREIGIGMALGIPRRLLSIRPMMVGAQVALVGVVAGIGVGWLVGQAMGDLLRSYLPLPVQRTPFQVGVFAQGAVLGLIIPMVASAIPVVRAVRVEPIEAMRAGHLAAKTSRLTDWTGRIRLPGSSFTQMPLRNVLRTPRRTVLTAVGVGAAITALIGVLGLLDSFGRTIDDIGDELTKGGDDRMLVQLDTFSPDEGGVVAAIGAEPAVGRVDAGLRLPAKAVAADDGEDIDLLVELVDISSARWTPTIESSESSDLGGGMALAQKAATDLGVGVGDQIRLRHVVQEASGSFKTVVSDVAVSAVHANPMRPFAYMDLEQAGLFGLSGQVNFAHAYPAAGADRDEVQRALFDLSGVTSSQSVSRIGEAFDEALTQFVGILAIAAIAVLVLALLIAFNATRIAVDERRREHATMRAFGVRVRTVIAVVVKESVVVGILATLIGIGAGLVFLEWMLRSLAGTTLPDLSIDAYLAPRTIAVAFLIGVLAVAVAPLFLIRRISAMSIPDTLRVME